MNILKFTTIRIFVLFLLICITSFCDDSTAENKKKLEKINAEIKLKISKQYKLYEEEKNLLFQIQRFDQKLEEKKRMLKTYNEKLLEIESNIRSMKGQMGYSNNEIVKIEEDLRIRVAQIYKEGKYKNLKMLISAISFKDFVKKYNYLLYLAKKDIELKNTYQKKKSAYNTARNNLEARYDSYEKLKKASNGKEKEILFEQESKKSLLKNILTEKALLVQAISESKNQSIKLEELVNEIEKKSKTEIKVDVTGLNTDVSKNKGKLPFPLKGSIVANFGKYKHPKFNAYLFSNGIEIAAKQDQEVSVIFQGVVLFADWFKGYGKTILIDCGNGVIMVYGHFSEISVNVGQKVTAGQFLGKAGEVGTNESPTLYVEIRKDGKPENPMEWLKK